MRKTILGLTVAATLGTGIVMANAIPANAASSGGSNCVSIAEKGHLRPGMSPGDVRRATHATPWFAVNDEYKGTPVRLEAYNDCQTNSKALAVMYRIDGHGGKHLMLSRFVAL